MSRNASNDSVDKISDHLHLPPEVLDRGSERSWHIGEFVVAGAVLVGLVYVGATVFSAAPRWNPTDPAGVASVQIAQP